MNSSVRARRRRQSGQPQAPTLRDVATRSGVSVATASRALTRPELVSERMRIKVEDAAAALAYRPNVAARELSSSTTRLAGAVLAHPGSSVTWRAFAAFERVLRDAGVSVVVAMRETPDTVGECARGLELRGARAIAIFGGLESRDIDTSRWILIDSGRGAGSLLALRYLFQLGHRHIAVEMKSGEEEIDTLVQDCADLGELRVDVVAGEGQEPSEVAASLIQQWESWSDKPTALVCGGDEIAAHAMRICRHFGIHVPDDLSVIGQGDSELARWSEPPLTSIRIAAEEAGARGAAELLAGEASSVRVHVPPVRLVLRGSCAPAAVSRGTEKRFT